MSIFSYLLFCNTNKPLKIGNFKGEIWRKSDLLLSHKFLIWKYGGFDSSLVVSHHRAGIALRTLSLISNHQHKMFVGLLQKRSRWLHAIVLNWCTEWDHVNVYIYTIQTIHTWVTWLKLTCYSPDGVDRFVLFKTSQKSDDDGCREYWIANTYKCRFVPYLYVYTSKMLNFLTVVFI